MLMLTCEAMNDIQGKTIILWRTIVPLDEAACTALTRNPPSVACRPPRLASALSVYKWSRRAYTFSGRANALRDLN